MADSANERQSEFLKAFSSYHLHRQPKSKDELYVFWSQDEVSQNYLSSADLSTQMIYDKIKFAFSINIRNSCKYFVQFWAPVTIGSRRLLSTFGQPFAVNQHLTFLNAYRLLNDYRLRSEEYQYNIDGNNLDVGLDPMIISGPKSTAFLSHFPEMVNLDNKGDPLECYAFRHASLTTSFMLPICFTSQNYCIGVIECSIGSRSPRDFEIIFRLQTSLKMVGLSMFHVQDRIPYKTIDGLKPAKDEIEKAVKIVCESHNILFAQVWIPYESESYELFSSSSADTQTKRMVVLKLTGYGADTDSEEYLEVLYNLCDTVPLQMRDEFVRKTLQDYKPRFCQDIYRLSNSLLSHVIDEYGHTEIHSLAICLRSIDTGDFNYTFEFVWSHNSNYVNFVEALLTTLIRCLPNFKFASGAKLGDELYVTVAKTSERTETMFFKIFQGNKLTPIPVSLEGRKLVVVDSMGPSEARFKTAEKVLSLEDIARQFGNTMEVAAKNLNVSTSTLKRKCRAAGISEWQGPKVVKRKVIDSHNNHVEISEENNVAIQDSLSDNRYGYTLTVKAKFADDTIKFHLRDSEATFVTVETEIGLKFKLTRGTYKLKYLDEDGELILILSDQDMDACIKHSRNLDPPVVRLHVLLSTQPLSGPTGYNGI